MLYFVPQLPVKNRYQEDWLSYFMDEFKKRNVDYNMILGDQFPVEIKEFFTNIKASVEWELRQLQILNNFVEDGDIIFFADVDFPGFAQPFVQTIKLRKKVKVYGYLHAGSYCKGDIFSNTPGKPDCERGILQDFDGIFVATNYHKQKLINFFTGEQKNVHVVGAPFYRKYLPSVNIGDREYGVIHTGRLDKQRSDKLLLSIIKDFPSCRFLSTRKPSEVPSNLDVVVPSDRKEYYDLLNRSYIYLNTSEEDTFSYGAVEAMAMGCVPLVPDSYSYPEVVPIPDLRYTNKTDLERKLSKLKANFTHKSQNLFGLTPFSFISKWEQSIPEMLKIMLREE